MRTSRIELKLKLLHIFPNILIYIIEFLKIFNQGKILNIQENREKVKHFVWNVKYKYMLANGITFLKM